MSSMITNSNVIDGLERLFTSGLEGIFSGGDQREFSQNILAFIYWKNKIGSYPDKFAVSTSISKAKLPKKDRPEVINGIISRLMENKYIESVDRSKCGGFGFGYKLSDNIRENFGFIFERYVSYSNMI